jgi:hypothetical protein
MANGDPIIIGLPNTASNPGTATILSRDENFAETVFVARNLNEGDGIRGEASGNSGFPTPSLPDPGGGPDVQYSAGVWGDSDTGLGVFGSSNATEGAGVVGRAGNGSDGMIAYSAGGLGIRCKSDGGYPAVYGSSGGFAMGGC